MRKARIEIIPMIDTIFFLLVFFMIASLNMTRMRAMSVALPKNGAPAAAAANGSGTGDLILTLTDTGDYYLGKQRLGPDGASLQAGLADRLQNATPRDVVLNLGKQQTAQSLVTVMDILNRARTASGKDVPVLIATEPVDQDGHALPSGSQQDGRALPSDSQAAGR
jgi:biopolymer transport protein ExbD